MMMLRPVYRNYIVAFLAGCVMLMLPLARTLHIDSAMLIGVIGAFVGAWIASGKNTNDREVLWIIIYAFITGIPLFIRDIFTGCLSLDGVAFWLFIPPFSTLFGFSIGRLCRLSGMRISRSVSLVAIFFTMFAGLLIPFWLFPQLYFFNHVFGYWPGPIYDESVAFPDRLVLFRMVTLAWTGIFWIIPHLKVADSVIKSIFGLLIASLALNYMFYSQHGLISPRPHIQTELSGKHHTENFTLYYSKHDYSSREVRFLGKLHEFHFSELVDTLRVSWPEEVRIESYLYGHEWQMKDVTGAKGVSFVPVWQRTPQMHIGKSAIDRTLRHEMVHVIAREFGNRLFNASWNIGLVEGLAVALSPASSARLTPDQLVVSNDALLQDHDIRRLFSLTGFYRQSSAVAYPVSGSFVRTLLQNYPVEMFKTAYRYSSLEKGYGEVLPAAVTLWHEEVLNVDVSEQEKAYALQRFTVPSIFDAKCPRVFTEMERNIDNYRRALTVKDTVAVILNLERALETDSGWESGWIRWIRLQLETGGVNNVLEKQERFPEHQVLAVYHADALVAGGQIGQAESFRDRQRAKNDLSRDVSKAWERRRNADLWKSIVQIRYHRDLFEVLPVVLSAADDDTDSERVFVWITELFRRSNTMIPAQYEGLTDKEYGIWAAQKDDLINKVIEMPANPDWFDVYRNLIYFLASHSSETQSGVIPDGDRNVVDAIIKKGNELTLRPVQQNRMEEAQRFVRFLLVDS